MKLLIIAVLISLPLTVAGQIKQEVSFKRDVFPILKAKCLKCHEQDDENPNELSMDSYELLMKGGKTNNIIVPGNANGSYFIVKLLPDPPKGKQMPIFSKKKLDEEEITVIRSWIDQGARNN